MDTYEKKYKEALDKARQLCAYPTTKPFINDLQDLFPELAESEDERIRKEIIRYLKRRLEISSSIPAAIGSWIAWLEKQGGQKPTIEMKSAEESLGIDSETYNEIVNTCIFGENKPKFKVGDWIVNNVSKDVFLIKSINNGYCTLEDIKGNIISPCLPPCESESHLWTIQDAKEGDILFQDLMSGYTFIYNGVNPNMAILYSFIISNDGEDVLPYHIGKPNTGIGNIEENKNIIHPATKEQRDLLFQKMHEVSYEWDKENKELKKIEQKSD